MSLPRAALYLRLSKEDGEGGGESQSIQNQRDFLLDYCAGKGLPVVDVYIDDGFTGTSFNRPDFLRLLGDIEAGLVNTVLTKDLSRLGRDYILTGYYLERYFPERGVRYIAVNDGIDTAAEPEGNDMAPFRAVFNDMYAKDISRKVRAALRIRRQMGKFIGTYAPYGYRKDPADKNRLVVDGEQAAQVRRIFGWFLAGETVSAIARRLTEEGVPTPSEAKGMACGKKPGAGWSYAMVRRVLSSPACRGALVSGMSRKVSYKVDKVVRLPQEEWLVAEGVHEPIVPGEVFARAQELLAVRSYAARGPGGAPKPLTGVFYCAGCGAPMVLWSNGKARYFVCASWKRAPGEHRCAAHYLREERVLEAVRGALARLVSAADAEALIARALAEGSGPPLREQLVRKRERAHRALLSLYEDRAEGKVSPGEYRLLADRLGEEARTLENRLAALPQEETGEAFSARARLLLDCGTLDRGMVLGLIGRIEAGGDGSVTIRFRCRAPG